jgi:hypothetical protein
MSCRDVQLSFAGQIYCSIHSGLNHFSPILKDSQFYALFHAISSQRNFGNSAGDWSLLPACSFQLKRNIWLVKLPPRDHFESWRIPASWRSVAPSCARSDEGASDRSSDFFRMPLYENGLSMRICHRPTSLVAEGTCWRRGLLFSRGYEE